MCVSSISVPMSVCACVCVCVLGWWVATLLCCLIHIAYSRTTPLTHSLYFAHDSNSLFPSSPDTLNTSAPLIASRPVYVFWNGFEIFEVMFPVPFFVLFLFFFRGGVYPSMSILVLARVCVCVCVCVFVFEKFSCLSMRTHLSSCC